MSIEKWCHLTNPCSVSIFLPSSFPALGNFPVSWFFTSGGWSIGVSASASVQLLSRVQHFATPWTAACRHPCPSPTPGACSNSCPSTIHPLIQWHPPVMPSNHLTLCHPLFLLPSIRPSIRVLSNEPVLCIGWPEYQSFSFSINPSNEHSDWFPLGWTGWISLQSKGLSRGFSNTTVQKQQFFGAQLSLQSNSHIHTQLLEKP